MRLIDADNAIHALGVFSDMEHGNKHFLNGINSAKEIINECVTIDAVPVVRGEWVVTDAYPHRVYCSLCHKTNVPNEESLFERNEYPKFCMWCGAKMEDKP
jgi:hypothetical protein